MVCICQFVFSLPLHTFPSNQDGVSMGFLVLHCLPNIESPPPLALTLAFPLLLVSLGWLFIYFFFPFSPLHVHNCCHLFNISSHRWYQLGCWVLPWVCWKCLSSVYSIGKPLVSSHSTQCHGLYKATYTHHSFTLCVSPLPLEAHGSAGLNWYFVREFLLCEVCVFLQGTVTEVKSPHLEKRVAGKGKDLNVKIIYFCSHKSSQVSVLVL